MVLAVRLVIPTILLVAGLCLAIVGYLEQNDRVSSLGMAVCGLMSCLLVGALVVGALRHDGFVAR